MPYETVLYERQGRIAYITLNRPDRLNTLTAQMDEELTAALEEFDMDDEAWVAILSGNGRCFCAGADVNRFQPTEKSAKRQRMMGPSPEGLLGRTANWKPVIAAVHNYCLGFGIALVLQCDLIVAAEDAKFGITETKRGVTGGSVLAKMATFMPSKVGVEMLLTGDPYPAAELYRLGLLNRLVPNGQHLEAAKELAEKILKAPPLAVRAGVRVSRWPWVQKAAEANLYSQALHISDTEDFKEAVQSFLEKREPVYKAR